MFKKIYLEINNEIEFNKIFLIFNSYKLDMINLERDFNFQKIYYNSKYPFFIYCFDTGPSIFNGHESKLISCNLIKKEIEDILCL